MNDVAVAALWMAVLAAALTPDPTRPWLLGLLTGLAVLVRPNLAPAAVVVGVWLIAMSAQRRRLRARPAAAQRVGVRAGGAAVGRRPGGAEHGAVRPPAAIGLRPRRAICSRVANVLPNLRALRARAVSRRSSAFRSLGAGRAARRRRARAPAVAWLAAGAEPWPIVAVYLFYPPFDEWWYLRFLLPALVPLTACSRRA